MGIEQTMVIGTLAELGVPDALAGGPATAAELAARVGADADALHRLLRAAAVHGLVSMNRRGRVRLTRLGRLLRSDVDGSLRPWARYMVLGSTRAAWGDLTESARTGRAAFPRVHGRSVWTWFAEHPDEGQLFAESMRAITRFEAPDLVTASLWPEAGRICDVAGGTGALLAAILDPRPELRGVLVDVPEVLAEAPGHPRIEPVAGDLFGELHATADVYVLKRVLHDWDDAVAAEILGRVRRTMPADSRLVIVEQGQERNKPHPFTSLVDLQMLTQCDDGRERSVRELQDLLAGAGLRPGRVERAGLNILVEGIAG